MPRIGHNSPIAARGAALIWVLLCAALYACSGVTEGARSTPHPAGIVAPGAALAPPPTSVAVSPCVRNAAKPSADPSYPLAADAEGSSDRRLATSEAQPMPAKDATVRYDDDTNTIVLRRGAPTTLAAVSQALGRPAALRELAPGEWLLAANLRVEKDAVLRIAAPEVRWLKLRSDKEDFVSIKALGSEIAFVDTCVTSWDAARGSFDEQDADGRSFVLARDGARMDIRSSELSYLGYEADESYGVAWRLAGTSGEITNSSFGYNFYGLYSYEVSELVIRGNDVHHSVRYGIDPHTRSNRLVIEGNMSHHNGKQGIILAEKCTDSVIRGNIVYNNSLHGIVLYQRSNHNLVEGNTVYGNGLQGININDSNENTVRNNTVYDNAEAGIGVGQDAKDNLIDGNNARDNRKDGIIIYSDASDNVLQNNTVSGNVRYGIYVKSEDNTIADGNQVFGNAVGIYLNVDSPQQVSQQTNRIYDNRQADIRAGGE